MKWSTLQLKACENTQGKCLVKSSITMLQCPMLKILKNSYLPFFLFVLMQSANADVSGLSNKDWHGWYVSGSVGSLINKSDIYTNHTQPYVAGMSPGGYSSVKNQANSDQSFAPGFQIGHNWTENNYLWGLEADYSPFKKSSTTCNSTPDSPNICNSSFYGWSNITSEIKNFGALKARFGYILNDFMFNVNAGYAYIQSSNLVSLNCPEACGPWDANPEVRNVKVSRKQFVPTYGLGVEYLLSSNFRLGMDYQFVRSNQLSQVITHDSTYLDQSIDSKISNSLHMLRLKVSYAF